MKEKICGIYVITNNINGKQYVGQSTNIEQRWKDHYSCGSLTSKNKDRNLLLYQAMREHGRDNFSMKILEECAKEDLKSNEVKWVSQLDSFNNGYNNSYGGDLHCYTFEHHGEDHGKAMLTLDEVKMCRKAYANGEKSRDIYDSKFSDRMTYSGFQMMWHGKNWKNIMPEVFENNPRPSHRVKPEHVRDIRKRVANGQSYRSISKDYRGTLGYGTIYYIATNQTYTDIV